MANLNDVAFALTQWIATDTQTHATATATQAANGSTEIKLRHIIYGWSFSFSGGTPSAGTIQVKDGSTVLDQIELAAINTAPIICEYKHALPCSPGNAATVTCSDLGASIKVTLTLRGRTVGT